MLPTSNPAPSARPTAYRKAGCWLEVVRLYRANGYSAREITNLLNDGLLILQKLHAEKRQIRQIPGKYPPECEIIPPLPKGHPIRDELNWHTATDCLGPVVTILSGEPLHVLTYWWNNHCWWTENQIIKHIRQQTAVGQMPPLTFRYRRWKSLSEVMKELREAEVAALGWEHMLPYDRTRTQRLHRLEQPWKGPPIDLTPREARILSLLYERGNMTGYELGDALGHKRGFIWSKLLGRLLEIGAVRVVGHRRMRRTGAPARVYGLAEGLAPHIRDLRKGGPSHNGPGDQWQEPEDEGEEEMLSD